MGKTMVPAPGSFFTRIKRSEAARQGLTHYFTGKPCPNKHLSRRYVSTRQCCDCVETARKLRDQQERPNRDRTWELRHPSRAMFNWVRARARRKGIPFDLELDDIVIPDMCPALGIPLEKHTGSSGGRDNSPSLDRINPSKGYVKGNVQVISNLANRIKNNATSEHLRLVADYMDRLEHFTWRREAEAVNG